MSFPDNPNKPNKPVVIERVSLVYEPKYQPQRRYTLHIDFQDEHLDRDFWSHRIEYESFEDIIEPLVNLLVSHEDNDTTKP